MTLPASQLGQERIQFACARVEFDLEMEAVGDGEKFAVTSQPRVVMAAGRTCQQFPAHLCEAAGTFDQVRRNMASGPSLQPGGSGPGLGG